jgi:two-component system capsular synthesis sensor histidine kinase RcsC
MHQVSRQAGRLNFLIENLMNYQATGAADLGWTDVTSVVEEVVAHQSGYPGAEGLSFRTHLASGLEAAATDRGLRLIASNLVNNAVKYATPGTRIDVSTRPVVIDGARRVEIVVSNEGAPIRPEDQERMFGAFVQLDSSITRSVPGVGLGLHIVGRTVAAYEGTVSVASEDGRIAFTVRLPCGSTVARDVA